MKDWLDWTVPRWYVRYYLLYLVIILIVPILFNKWYTIPGFLVALFSMDIFAYREATTVESILDEIDED